MFQEELSRELKSFLSGRPAAARLVRVPEETGANQTRKRQLEWLESRRLEKEVQEDLLLQGADKKSVTTSVSHSTSIDGNWVVVIGSDQSLGVDLEDSQREFQPNVASRIISESESQFKLKPLEFWVAKEAAFKANPGNQGTVLPQYRVVQWNDLTRTGEILFPETPQFPSCHFKLLQMESWLIAIARTP